MNNQMSLLEARRICEKAGYSVLDEGNVLSRIFSVSKDPGKCMAIFTASRSENTEEENDKGNAEIRSELRRLKVGYRIGSSHWPENVKGELVDHIDDSTIVVLPAKEEEFLTKFAINVCKKYNQDGAFFKKSTGEVGIYDKDGKFMKIGNEFHPDKVSEYMTEIKGRSFVFEDVSEYVKNSPSSWAGAYGAQWQRNHYE